MKRTPATIVLLGLFAVGFVIEIATHSVGNYDALLRLGALPDNGGLHRDYWRVATYAFLHYDAFHLFLNVALLFWIGRIVEINRGITQFLIIFGVSVFCAAIVVLIAHRLHPHPGSTVGASGGNFGLLAAALLFSYRANAGRLRNLRRWIWIVLAVGFAISFLPAISMAGHIGGVIGGGLVALYFGKGSGRFRPSRV